MTTMKSVFRMSLLAAVCGAVPVAASTAPSSTAVVSTLAGSGLPGFADGTRTSASFLMPVAVAYDPAGNLLVLDAAAQRIRRVRADGRVETVAGSGALQNGWVAGGFADGEGRTARFNWPRGIAVAKNGTIYVADTGNHCIRAITPSGRVTLFAGSPSRVGGRVGNADASRFMQPMGVAVDSKDNVYVADPQAGLRKIDAGGHVSELPLGHHPVGVSVAELGGNLTIYIADADGVLIAYPDGRHWRLRSLNRAAAADSAPDAPGTVEREMAMQAPVGYPQSLTTVPDDHLFFADPRTNTIRYLYPSYALSKTLAGMPTEDAAGEGAGFRDGDASEARFNEPLGTAASPDGTIAIADTGNRRIRLLHVDKVVDLAETPSLLPSDASPNVYRIILVGPSVTWYDSTGVDSITSRLQAKLEADNALAGANLAPNVRFMSGVATLDPLDSVARTVAELGVDKVLILDVTANTIAADGLVKALADPAAWQAPMTARLKSAGAILAAAHVRFIVAIHPLPYEFSANEDPISRGGLPGVGAGRIPELRIHDLLRQAVVASGVQLIDAYPDFRADAMSPSEPISGNVDSHYARHGRALYAESLARALEKLAPWVAGP